MHKKYAGLLVFLFCTAVHSELSFSAGPIAWSAGSDFMTGIQPGIYYDTSISNSVLYAGLEIPVLIQFKKQALIPGIRFYENHIAETDNHFYFLNEKKNLSLSLQRLSIENPDYKIGFYESRLEPSTAYRLYTTDFLFNSNLPYRKTTPAIQYDQLQIIGSSLPDPDSLFATYCYKPFLDSQIFILKDIAFQPVLYSRIADFSQLTSVYGGAELKTGGVRAASWGIGSMFSGAAGLEKIKIHDAIEKKQHRRFTTELWFDSWLFYFQGGLVFQSKNHTAGPYLSDLTPGRSGIAEFSTHELGFLMHLRENEDLSEGWLFDVEINGTQHATGSLRTGYTVKGDSWNLSFSVSQENFKTWREFWQKNGYNTFFGFDFKAVLIEKMLHFRISLYQNYSENSQFRTRLETIAFF